MTQGGQIEARHADHHFQAAHGIASAVSGIVVKLPSCPVFIACSMSKASAPRHSPTIIRSGRIRRAFAHKVARCDIAFAFNVYRASLHPANVRLLQLQFGRIFNGDHALVGRNEPREALRSVVLPVPVPPEINTLTRAWTQAARNCNISAVIVPLESRSSLSSGRAPNRRIETKAPSIARGGIMALSRLPSGRRASTIGQVSSTRRPARCTIRCITCSRCRSS